MDCVCVWWRLHISSTLIDISATEDFEMNVRLTCIQVQLIDQGDIPLIDGPKVAQDTKQQTAPDDNSESPEADIQVRTAWVIPIIEPLNIHIHFGYGCETIYTVLHVDRLLL